MPSDGYYGDMNGDWSSSPSTLPSDVELMVGRVDLADMPGNGAPVAWPNETELLRNYLNKDHRWRFHEISVPRRSLIADRFGTFNGETRASTGYRTFAPFVGPENMYLADVSDAASPDQRWISLLTSGSYLWAYGNGGGQDTSISELGLHGQYNDVWSTDLFTQDPKAVFFMLEGSHFGNWDHTDDIMRAVLAMPTMGLFVCCIAGHPHYYIHHMGLGEPIGYGIRLTMNNDGFYHDTTNEFLQAVYIALMGDPTLRMEPVTPPSNLNGSASAGVVTLNWSASPDSVAGYHIYRATSPAGPYTRLTSSLVSGTSFQDNSAPAGNSTYMVRAVTLQVNPSGSYFNPSQGVFATVNSSGGTNTAPTITAIADQTITENTSAGGLAFTIGDAETAAAALTVHGTSSNPDLIPDSALAFGGSGSHRTVTLTPSPNQTGEATITITVSDGSANADTSLLLTVNTADTNGTGHGPFLTGIYNGLFAEADQARAESAGAFSLTLKAKSAYSGHLQLGSRKYSFSGTFDDQGTATNVLKRPRENSLTVEMQVGSDDQAGQISGRVTDGTWDADLTGLRAPFNAKTNAAPFAGDYTLVLPGTKGDSTLPAGDGYALVRVTSSGATTLAGTLADGTSFSQSTAIAADGSCPLYVSLYSGQGLVAGWLQFANRPDDDINGTLTWVKPASSRSRNYPAGFSEQLQALGSKFHRPPGTNAVLDLPNATVGFLGGGLTSEFTNNVNIGRSSRVTNQSGNRLSLTFATSTGRFSGSVTDPAGGKPMPFSGVVFQKINSGFGFLMGKTESSEVIIGP
jgi:hypothetical protein